MSTSNAVKLLAKTHSEIQGSIEKAEQKLKQLTNSLGAIKASIYLFYLDYNIKLLNSKRSNKKNED